MTRISDIGGVPAGSASGAYEFMICARQGHRQTAPISPLAQISGRGLPEVVGFDLVHGYVVAEQKKVISYIQGTSLDSEEFQDTCMFTYHRLLSDEFCTSGIHRATQGEVKTRNKLDGENL